MFLDFGGSVREHLSRTQTFLVYPLALFGCMGSVFSRLSVLLFFFFFFFRFSHNGACHGVFVFD